MWNVELVDSADYQLSSDYCSIFIIQPKVIDRVDVVAKQSFAIE